ncbi:GRIP and coiled-coil domain-containing protein 2-like isoform X1 [Corticium candelabrum]|uniref:GRIP and coiled-coil domain-containing protein 2-like isoform X1 n=1 Tax=Corticium candelabrum TaxID=121492 RepID=UPI002E25DF83|nr:GRIP and coiled-coil domain-containing protein 2-like isoform X1 [Corticium candelabrum]
MEWLKKAYATVEEEMGQYVSPKKSKKTEGETTSGKQQNQQEHEEGTAEKKQSTDAQEGDDWDDWQAEESPHPGTATSSESKNEPKERSSVTENLGKNRNVNERASPKVVDVAQSAEIVKPATSGSAAEGTPTKGKSQMESLSKEDLVKYVKRQAQLVQKSKAKYDELMKRHTLLEAENNQLKERGQSEDVDEKFHTLSDVRDRLAEQLQSVVTQHEQLQKDHKEQAAKLVSLSSDRDKVGKELELLQVQYQTTQHAKQDVDCRLIESDEKVRKLEQQVGELQCQVMELETSTSVRQEIVEKEEIEELQQATDAMQAQLAASQGKLAEEIEKHEKQLKEYCDERCKLVADLQESEQLNHRLSMEVETLRTERDTLQTDVQEKEELIQQTSSEAKKQYSSEIVQLNESISCLQAELVTARDKVHSLESQLSDTVYDGVAKVDNDQFSQINSEKEEALMKLEQSEKRVRELLTENETLKNDCKQQVLELQKEEPQSKELDSERQTLERKLGETMREQEELQQQLKELTNNKQADLLKLSDCEMQCSKLSAEVNTIKADNDRLQAALQKSEVQVKQTRAEAEQQHFNDMERLTETTETLETELQESRKRVEQLESQLSNSIGEGSAQLKDVNDQLKQMARERAEALLRLEESEKDADGLSTEIESLKMDLKRQQVALQEKDVKIKEIVGDKEVKERKLQENAKEQDALRNQLAELRSAHEQLEETLKAKNQECTDLEKKRQDLGRQLDALQTNLKTQQKQLADTELQLQGAVKEAKQSNVMDLELADYQRTIESLEQRIRDKELEITTNKEEMTQRDQLIETMKRDTQLADQQREQTEERAKKMKVVLVKTKKELSDAKTEVDEQKQREAELAVQVEMLTQANEEEKVHVATLTSQLQALQEQVRATSESHHRSTRLLEQKLASSHSEVESTKSLLATSQSEFEAYKVRVHSVLKQQKAKSSSKQEHEGNEAKRQRYEEVIDQLKKEHEEAKESLVAAVSDRDNLEEELDRLSVRHDKLIQDSIAKENQWREKMEETRTAAVAKDHARQETIKDLTKQNETLTASFKEQLKGLQQDHRHTVEVLQGQVATLEESLTFLQTRQNKRPSPDRAITSPQDRETLPTSMNERQRPAFLESDDVFRERQQAEGMDQMELESLALTTPGSDLPESSAFSLERLLSGSDESMRGPGLPDDKAKQQLVSALKQVEHLTGVLRETEATSMRLSEQAKVLKEEIRRLERNRARDEGVNNLEYLKNVVLKFVQSTGSEQEHLITVMSTLLKLSPEEKMLINEAVKGDDSQTTQQGSGWSSYVHRWTGF